MKKLAIDTADFKKLIEEDKIYVDKTKYLYDIVSNHTYYFLSRPRRFGKSLFISTLEVFFSGKRELFKDLYIYDKVDSWEEYPIIKLDFNIITVSSIDRMKANIGDRLKNIVKNYDVYKV